MIKLYKINNLLSKKIFILIYIYLNIYYIKINKIIEKKIYIIYWNN